MGDDEYRTCEVVETDRVGGRKKSSSSQQEEEEEEARGGGGLEVQVNDKKTSVRQREVWFMLYSSSEKRKTKGKSRSCSVQGPSPILLSFFPLGIRTFPIIFRGVHLCRRDMDVSAGTCVIISCKAMLTVSSR